MSLLQTVVTLIIITYLFVVLFYSAKQLVKAIRNPKNQNK